MTSHTKKQRRRRKSMGSCSGRRGCGSKSKMSWCTAKVASKLKNQSSCVKNGCNWEKDWKARRRMLRKGIKVTDNNFPMTCDKISTEERVTKDLPNRLRKMKKSRKYCNKYRIGSTKRVNRRKCNRDPRCRYSIDPLDVEHCYEVK